MDGHGIPASEPDVPRRARLGLDGGVLLRLLGYRDVGARPHSAGFRHRRHAAINVVVLNPLFLGTFFGTALLSLVLDIVALMDWSAPWSGYLVTGSLLYFVGTFLVTLLFNVPLNNRLAAVKPDSAEGKAVWTHYLRVWTAWNHVRTVAPLAAMAAFILAFGKMWS